MAKRRTRSQKVSARHTYTYTLRPLAPSTHQPQTSNPPAMPAASPTTISIQFPKLIAFDLIKTILISAVIFAIQIGLYIFWR